MIADHMIADEDLLERFFLRLQQHDVVGAAEQAALRAGVSGIERLAPGQDMVREGDRPLHSTVILEGLAFRYAMLRDGRRQIVALHLPGDFVDLHSFALKEMDHSVGAASRCVIARIRHETLFKITEQFPHLTRLLWLLTLIDGAIMREWAIGLGRRSAAERMAHILLEFHLRMLPIGLDGDNSFELPVTQTDFGDMLGLTPVHTNRVLQNMRADGLVAWEGTLVKLLDIPRLTEIAGFDDRYLHRKREPR